MSEKGVTPPDNRCHCQRCATLRKVLEERGEQTTWKGIPILTEHDLALVDWPYGSEPE